jgi:hypothetical protein
MSRDFLILRIYPERKSEKLSVTTIVKEGGGMGPVRGFAFRSRKFSRLAVAPGRGRGEQFVHGGAGSRREG